MEALTSLIDEIAKAAETTTCPDSNHTMRMEALHTCERFKENSPYCAEIGFHLSTDFNRPKFVQYFGMQLIEHVIKFRWTEMNQQQKLYIKENAMKLLLSANYDVKFLKDGLSRIIVEMIKREWPQQWQSLLVELGDVCRRGEIQTEIVLLIFLRLVEDVAVLQTLESTQRRRDIYQALTSQMGMLFTFFLQLIEGHLQTYEESADNSDKKQSNQQVVSGVLETLCGFIDWVSHTHLIEQNGRLIQIICLLLTHSVFQNLAVDCLLQVVNRKGKVEERKVLQMEVFSEHNMKCIVQASKIQQPLNGENYVFLKKYVNMLAGLCSQLCFLCGKEGGITTRPMTFALFLEAIIEICQHQNLMLIHLANPIWISMFRHDIIGRDPLLVSLIPKWVQFMAPKLIRINFTLSPYAIYEFESEDVYTVFFTRFRSDLLESFRFATIIAPLVTYNYVDEWLRVCLNNPYIELKEWDALTLLLDNVLGRILQVTERPSIMNGLSLLEQCLFYKTTDLNILSNLISCISSLFVFLSMASGHMAPAVNSVALAGAALLPKVLDRIFSVLLFPLSDCDDKKVIKGIRRHAVSVLVKLGIKYPLLLLPVFDQIQATVLKLSINDSSSQLTVLEQVTLQEFLLLISNHFCDYDKQTRFIEDIFREANSQWLMLAELNVFKNAEYFIKVMDFIKTTDLQTKLKFCVSMLYGIVKRCSVPDDPERAARGGFVMGSTEAGNPICRNPATPYIIPILPHLLGLARVLNEFFTPETLLYISDNFRLCLEISDFEKNQILGSLSDQIVQQNDHSQTQNNSNFSNAIKTRYFIVNVFDQCYQLLGILGPSLGRDLFHLDGLGNAIVNSVFAYFDYVPDYRIRPMIRNFFKPFAASCPPSYYRTVMVPIMMHIAPLMLKRLNKKWQEICNIQSNPSQDENQESEELINDTITRILTREYLDVLKIILIGGSITNEPHDFEELSMEGPPVPTRSMLTNEVITELGTILLRNDTTNQAILLTVLGSLSWIDSIACLKATVLISPMIKQLVADGMLSSEIAVHVIKMIIQALSLHGQHEGNQGVLLTVGVQMYDILRPKYPEVITVMQQIPGVNSVDIQKLDERASVCTPNKGNRVEKFKKDMFKKIIGSLIGKNVSQLFRKEVVINDLPRIKPPRIRRSMQTINTNLSNLLG